MITQISLDYTDKRFISSICVICFYNLCNQSNPYFVYKA